MKSGAAPLSSDHELPPSVVRSGTAPPRSMNIVEASLMSSFESEPVRPAAVLQPLQLLPWSDECARHDDVIAYSEFGRVGSTARPPACGTTWEWGAGV